MPEKSIENVMKMSSCYLPISVSLVMQLYRLFPLTYFGLELVMLRTEIR